MDTNFAPSETAAFTAGAEVADLGAVRLDQDDVAVRADRGHHVQVQGLLLVPAGLARCARQRAGQAILVDLAETAAGHGARGQVVLGAVQPQVRCGVRVVEGVHDRDRLAPAGRGRGLRQAVRALQIGGPVAGRDAVPDQARVGHATGLDQGLADLKPGRGRGGAGVPEVRDRRRVGRAGRAASAPGAGSTVAGSPVARSTGVSNPGEHESRRPP